MTPGASKATSLMVWPTAYSANCSAVNTVRTSVCDTSMGGTCAARTFTASSVVAEEETKSTWAPEATSTCTSRLSAPSVTLYLPGNTDNARKLPLESAVTVRVWPESRLWMVMTCPASALPKMLPVVLCACTPPMKHMPSAMLNAVRLMPLDMQL